MPRDLFDEVHEEELKTQQDLHDPHPRWTILRLSRTAARGNAKACFAAPETHAFQSEGMEKSAPERESQ